MSKKTVLIIEDDPALLRGLKDNFQSCGYVVDIAIDGELGVEMALSIKPNLIILDIMLPKLNGYEVCELIRRAELEMPIIMLTAKGEEKDIIRGLNLGADDYLTKPYKNDELVAKIKKLLGSQNGSSGNSLPTTPSSPA